MLGTLGSQKTLSAISSHQSLCGCPEKAVPTQGTIVLLPAELCLLGRAGEEPALGLGPSFRAAPLSPWGTCPREGRFHPAPAGSGEPHMGLLAEAQAE